MPVRHIGPRERERLTGQHFLRLLLGNIAEEPGLAGQVGSIGPLENVLEEDIVRRRERRGIALQNVLEGEEE